MGDDGMRRLMVVESATPADGLRLVLAPVVDGLGSESLLQFRVSVRCPDGTKFMTPVRAEISETSPGAPPRHVLVAYVEPDMIPIGSELWARM